VHGTSGHKQVPVKKRPQKGGDKQVVSAATEECSAVRNRRLLRCQQEMHMALHVESMLIIYDLLSNLSVMQLQR
jgi:hypothetical protein